MKLMDACYDLDLDRLADEALVVLAQECAYRPAAEVLLERYHAWVGRLVGRRACHSCLQPADVEDARQNAVLGLAEAIRCYDTSQLGRRDTCHFRTFLLRVVSARYLDFVRRLWRWRRRHRNWAALDEVPVPARHGGPVPHGRGDPVGAAERGEEQAWLERALRRLDEDARSLWERLAAGTPLRAVARDLGLSYDAAKRARRRLLAALTDQLPQAEKIAPPVPRPRGSGE